MKERHPVKPSGREAVMGAVVEAAIELFSTRAFRDVTMVEIGRQAGVNPGLIHMYFGSKEDVIHEAAAESLDRLHQEHSRYRKEPGGIKGFLGSFSACRRYFHLLLPAATTPLSRPLTLRLDDLPGKLAESLGLEEEEEEEEGPLPGLSGRETALGLLVMGIGFLVLERSRASTGAPTGRAPDPRVAAPWSEVYPRWLEAVLPAKAGR